MQISRRALVAATPTQLKALQALLDSHWEHVPEDKISAYLDFGNTIMVNMGDIMLIGIEPDGYTHS